MATSQNAAGRLHAALVLAVKDADNKPMREVWARVFGVDQADTGEILRHLAVLFEQKSKAETQIKALGGEQEVFLRPIRGVERLFSEFNLAEHLQKFKGRIPHATIETLEVAAEALRLRHPAGELATETRESLLGEIDVLAEHIRAADLESEAKAGCIELVERLRRALILYQLVGTDGVLEAVERNLGFIAREALAPEEAGIGAILKEVMQTTILVWNTARAAVGLTQIGADAGEALGRLTSGT